MSEFLTYNFKFKILQKSLTLGEKTLTFLQKLYFDKQYLNAGLKTQTGEKFKPRFYFH